jgi:very-short-patch-repair endonuclease
MRERAEITLAAFARAQLGVSPRAQLLDAGLTDYQVRYLVRFARLERIFESVYRIAGVPESWRQGLLAACWAGGDRGGFVSHRAAAALWNLPGGEELLEITTPRWRRGRHAHVVVHETLIHEPIDITVIDATIPVTRPARTFLDCCSLVQRGLLAEATVELQLQEAIRRDLVDIAFVGARWERLGGERRPGGSIARRLIDRWLPATRRTDSRPEAVLMQLIHAHDLPLPVPQYRVWLGPDEYVGLDFAWPEQKVGLEFDSYRHHGGRMKHDLDARRVLRLEARAWHMLRVTDEELDAGCPNALAALARLLRPAA